MSSKNYDAEGYGHNLDLLLTLHELRVSHWKRSGCREKSIRITHVYLTRRYRKTPTFYSCLENEEMYCLACYLEINEIEPVNNCIKSQLEET